MSAIDWNTIRKWIRTWVVNGSGLPLARVFWGGVNTPRPSGTSEAYIAMRFPRIDRVGPDWVVVEDNPLVLDDDVVELVDDVTNTLTLTAHAYLTGDGPVQLETDDTLPGGLEPSTNYWVIKTGSNTIKFASTFAHAMAGTGIVDITDSGTGTHTIVGTNDTVRAGQEVNRLSRGMRKFTLQLTCFPPLPADDATDAQAILSDVMASQADFGVDGIGSALSGAGVGISTMGPITAIDGVINTTRFEARAMMNVTFFVTSELSTTGRYIETVEVQNNTTDEILFVPEDPTP